MSNLEIARIIADAASYLDFLKCSHSKEIMVEARQHVDNLHTLAVDLAASQVGELYLTEISAPP